MKVSDYIMNFLYDHGIKDLFLLSGGGMMHLLDAAKRHENLNLVFNLHEQASSICAESYAQFTHNLGACMVTTGPGATNAFTGCAGAWVDSTPVMFISGQCKTEQMGQLTGLRIYGSQEIAIVPCVKPITKYAVTVLKKEEIRYHMEKSLYLATHGRKGPVWIDVPLDVQGANIEVDELQGFDPKKEGYEDNPKPTLNEIEKIYSLLNKAKRPVILAGHGVMASNAQETIRKITEKFNLPALSTWRAKGIWGDEEELYMGSCGAPGTRYSNYVVQNCDLLIVVGTRLNPAITAFDEPHFAPLAKKVMVDIEKAEMDKLNIEFELKIESDAGEFLNMLLSYERLYEEKDRTEWLSYCKRMKEKYPLNKEKQVNGNKDKVDGFAFAEKLSDYSKDTDIFVGSSSGRTCGISHMAYRLKKGQRFVTSMGLGSMGWCIPSAISCCIAGGKQRTLVLEGDGSLQHNIQELQLISTYKLPLKIFVFSNKGYASIYTMQRNNFKSRFAGCNGESGVILPSMEKIAMLYGLKYSRIANDSEIDRVLREVMKDDSPCLCELEADIDFDEIPKSITIANDDGTFTSSKLEYLYPFLSKEEQADNMPEWD